MKTRKPPYSQSNPNWAALLMERLGCPTNYSSEPGAGVFRRATKRRLAKGQRRAARKIERMQRKASRS